MGSSPRKLPSAHAMALFCFCCWTSSVYSFSFRSSSTNPVPSSDRLSPDQLFAKEYEIISSGTDAFANFDVDLIGRVFITYAEDTSSEKGVFGKIKVSGNSEGAVEFVQVNEYVDISVYTHYFRHTAKSSDSLLVEIQLYKKNSLKQLSMSGEADVVILENVLYSIDKDPTYDSNNFRALGASLSVSGNGSLFLSDPAGSVMPNGMSIDAFGEGSGSIQVELAKLNNTHNSMDVSPWGSGNISLFVDQLITDVWLFIGDDDNLQGRLCISAKSSVNVTEYRGEPGSLISSPGKQDDGLPCVKLPLPERVPVKIGEGRGNATEANNGTAAPANQGEKSAAVSIRDPSSMVVALSGLMVLVFYSAAMV